MHRTASRGLRAALMVLVLGALLGLLVVPASAQTPPPEDRLNVLLLSPLVKIYEGDTVTIPYIAEDITPRGLIPLAPLTPGNATVQAAIGSASVQAENTGGIITYHAEKSGQETLSLLVENALGSGTGALDFVVHPQPNYSLDFFITSQDTDESGAGFRALFSGSGEFSSSEDTPVYGRGEADLWFSLWAITQPFKCQMTPPVQSHTAFEILPADEHSLAPLVREPGYISPIDLSLQFQPMSLNASSILCEGLGGINANFPWPAQQADADDYGLKNLHFPGEGGIVPYQNVKTEGLIIVTRIQP